MTPDQFRAALADLGLSQAGFARLAMVDARTVRRWCDGTRAVPGPVVALLRILMVTDEWREIPLERWRALLPDSPPKRD
jgi:DNA-binding transcriptional regulator YiaG